MNSRVTIILVIMAIYLAGMLWIGLKGRKYSETNKDFMTAAKQGSMLLVVGSYLGSHLGNGVVVGGAQYGALYGIGGLWYGAGAALSFVLFALVMSKIVYKKGYLTLPDVLSDRYGGKVVSVLIAILHYCTMIAICAGQIMAGRLLFEYVGLPGTAGAAITFIIVIGYSTMSGLWGVLMTDVVQSSIIFVVTIVGVIWIFAQGGWSVMTANLPATSFQIMPFNAETMIMMFGPSALFGLTSATAFQRTVASKTMKIAFWAPIIASVLVVAYAALPVLMGMYGHALWPEADTSIVFFKLLMEKMPPVMAGLMVACICAAVMSTCDGGLIAGSANIVNDIYLKVINPDGEADQKKLSTLKPDFVIPFKLSREDAIQRLKQHYKGKVFLPKSFSSENHLQEISGVYVPFWMFSGEAEGDAHFDATRSRTYKSGDYRITETDHYDAYRAGSLAFEKIPVDGSEKMPDEHMDSIEPYDYSELKPFSTAYLPGFLADKFDVTAEDSRQRADSRCAGTLRSALEKTVSGYETCSARESNTTIKRGKVHYALMPVWMLNTKWRGKDFLFAMNGQTGKLVGDLPVDKGRYWAMFFAIAVPLSAIGSFLAMTLLR